MSSELPKPPPVEVVWHGGQVHPEDRNRLLVQRSVIHFGFLCVTLKGELKRIFALRFFAKFVNNELMGA
jgi:hypothetical protein